MLAARIAPLIRGQHRCFASKPLPDRADAVIIGGGSVGASCAYHLAAQGFKTVLLEQNALTAGTTWHTAGMLWRLRPNYVDVELQDVTRNRCKALEVAVAELEGEPAGARAGSIWTENGALFIATNAERVAEYERLVELGTFYGIDARMLDGGEARRAHPLLRVDDVAGALYSPGDGTIDAFNVVDGYRRVATARHGAVFSEGARVARVACDGDAVAGVVLDDGRRVDAPVVVNCGGAWAPAVQRLVDRPSNPLPLLAMKHAYVVTETVPGMHGGLPNVRDHDLSIYLKAQGDAIALGGYETNPEFWRMSPDDEKHFSFGLFDLDWETFDENIQNHMHRCPSVEDAGIKSTVCGPESFTPDHKPLVGPAPGGPRGLWLCCGFNSMGIMLAGGMGEELAHWVATGAAKRDLFGADARRFHGDCASDAAWVKRSTHESYAKTYAVVFPHDEHLAGRGLRPSPFEQGLLAAGCVFQSRHGMERPGWFEPDAKPGAPRAYDYYGAYDDEGSAWRLDWVGGGPEADGRVPSRADDAYRDAVDGELTFGWGASFPRVAAECRAAREGAALFDQSYFGKFLLEGPGAAAAAKFMSAGDPDKAAGDVTYTVLCDANGGVEADLTMTKLSDTAFYVVSGGATKTKDLAWIEARAAAFDVRVDDVSDDFGVLSVQGPRSRQVLAPLVGGLLDDLATFPFSTAKTDATIAGVAGCKLLRLTFVGELGFELHVPRAGCDAVYAAVKRRGSEVAAASGAPVADAGYRAMDSLSADKGYRHWHADLSNAETPFEAGIGFTVARRLKSDGDFLGRSALEAAKRRGAFARKRIVCLSVDADDAAPPYDAAPPADAPLHGSETIWRGDECVGLVRSVAYSHALRRTLAYGYVHAAASRELGGGAVSLDFLKAGAWSVGDRGRRRPATFHAKAPYDPTNAAIKTAAY